jgi:hypothetical protein
MVVVTLRNIIEVALLVFLVIIGIIIFIYSRIHNSDEKA